MGEKKGGGGGHSERDRGGKNRRFEREKMTQRNWRERYNF